MTFPHLPFFDSSLNLWILFWHIRDEISYMFDVQIREIFKLIDKQLHHLEDRQPSEEVVSNFLFLFTSRFPVSSRLTLSTTVTLRYFRWPWFFPIRPGENQRTLRVRPTWKKSKDPRIYRPVSEL
jgi:hypothetical protein